MTTRITIIAIQMPGLAMKMAQPCLNQFRALPASTRRLLPLNCGAGIGKDCMSMLV